MSNLKVVEIFAWPCFWKWLVESFHFLRQPGCSLDVLVVDPGLVPKLQEFWWMSQRECKSTKDMMGEHAVLMQFYAAVLMQFWCSLAKTPTQFWRSFDAVLTQFRRSCIKTASDFFRIFCWFLKFALFFFFNKSSELGFGNGSLCSFLQSMEVAWGKIHQGLTEVKYIHQVQSQIKFMECSLKSTSWSPVSSKVLWSPVSVKGFKCSLK